MENMFFKKHGLSSENWTAKVLYIEWRKIKVLDDKEQIPKAKRQLLFEFFHQITLGFCFYF